MRTADRLIIIHTVVESPAANEHALTNRSKNIKKRVMSILRESVPFRFRSLISLPWRSDRSQSNCPRGMIPYMQSCTRAKYAQITQEIASLRNSYIYGKMIRFETKTEHYKREINVKYDNVNNLED